MAALIAEEAYDSLRGPVVRLGGLDIPIPFSKTLEGAAAPGVAAIFEKAAERWKKKRGGCS